MEITNQQLKEAILFLMDVSNKSETDGDITREIEFVPESISPYKVLTNAGNIFMDYTALTDYDELHNYIRKFLGDLHDYDVGMNLMHITSVADAIKNTYQATPGKINNNLGTTANNNIRDLLIYFKEA